MPNLSLFKLVGFMTDGASIIKLLRKMIQWCSWSTYKSLISNKTLPPLMLVYDLLVLWNHAFACVFELFSCHFATHNLPDDCARPLFKRLKDAASRWVCNKIIFFVLAFVFCVCDVISEVGFWRFWLRLPATAPSTRRKQFAQAIIGN